MTLDEYIASIRDAEVDYILTGPSVAPWSLQHIDIGGLVLQFGSDGGSSVASGVLRADAVVIIWPIAPLPHQPAVNGIILPEDDIAVLHPGGEFIFSMDGPRSWCSIALPVKALPDTAQAQGLSEHCLVSARAKLSTLVNEAKDAAQRATPAVVPKALADKIQATCIESVLGASKRPIQENPSLRVVHRVLQMLREEADTHFLVEELAERLAISERTLLRYFQNVLHVGPKRYLAMRQLNILRRALRDPANLELSITQLFALFGVTEFGRVSGQYRDLFGELPSETQKRVRTLYRQVAPAPPEAPSLRG